MKNSNKTIIIALILSIIMMIIIFIIYRNFFTADPNPFKRKHMSTGYSHTDDKISNEVHEQIHTHNDNHNHNSHGRNPNDEIENIKKEEHILIQKRFPDNLWVNGNLISKEVKKRNREIRNEAGILHEKYTSGKISKQEKKRYFTLKIMLLQDWGKVLKYSIKRVPEIENEKGVRYVQPEEVEGLKKQVEEIDSEIARFKKMFSDL